MNIRKTLLFSALAAVLFPCAYHQARADVFQTAKLKTTPTTHRLRRPEILDQLKLTFEQRKLLHEYRAAHRKKLAEIEGQIRIKKVEMESELEKSEPDQAKLDILAKEIGGLYGKRLSEKINAKMELEKKILTPQQAEQLKVIQLEESSPSEDDLKIQE
jgi:Spy/CpxP family protein refolding chaperone